MKTTLLAIILCAITLVGADLQLGWNASPSTNVAYKVYQSAGNSALGTNIATTTNITITLSNVTPAALRYWVTVVEQSTNSWRLESDPSNVVILPEPVKPVAPALWLMILKP